jgi:hypothetical protein
MPRQTRLAGICVCIPSGPSGRLAAFMPRDCLPPRACLPLHKRRPRPPCPRGWGTTRRRRSPVGASDPRWYSTDVGGDPLPRRLFVSGSDRAADRWREDYAIACARTWRLLLQCFLRRRRGLYCDRPVHTCFAAATVDCFLFVHLPEWICCFPRRITSMCRCGD